MERRKDKAEATATEKEKSKMKEAMKWITEEESGQGMVEYIIVVGLVALAAVAGFRMLGTNISTKARNLANQINAL